jgi:hypothetical protein
MGIILDTVRREKLTVNDIAGGCDFQPQAWKERQISILSLRFSTRIDTRLKTTDTLYSICVPLYIIK